MIVYYNISQHIIGGRGGPEIEPLCALVAETTLRPSAAQAPRLRGTGRGCRDRARKLYLYSYIYPYITSISLTLYIYIYICIYIYIYIHVSHFPTRIPEGRVDGAECSWSASLRGSDE